MKTWIKLFFSFKSAECVLNGTKESLEKSLQILTIRFIQAIILALITLIILFYFLR
jgi:hypothetical protein